MEPWSSYLGHGSLQNPSVRHVGGLPAVPAGLVLAGDLVDGAAQLLNGVDRFVRLALADAPVEGADGRALPLDLLVFGAVVVGLGRRPGGPWKGERQNTFG